MKYIFRNKSIITYKKNLEHLYTLENFPAFISYVDSDSKKKDIKADMSFSICPESGILQLDKVLSPDIVYQAEHSVGIGKVWEDHYKQFVSFINSYRPIKVLEIGGGNGIVAKKYTKDKKNIAWTIVEPLPLCEETEQIKVIPAWFDKNFVYEKEVDTIIHSHVLEHMYDPEEFLDIVYSLLTIGGKHLFSVPNLYTWLSKKYINTLNFEHTIFLTEYFIDYLLEKTGFKILKKQYYDEHSIFYSTKKLAKKSKVKYDSKYSEYKKMFLDYVNYYQNLVNVFNKKILDLNIDTYLFGAHVFSQFLLNAGLNEKKISGVLDNATIKQNKRLYGTSLFVSSPETIKGRKPVAVILKAAGYQEEIREQLLNLNNKVIILE